MRIPAPTKQLMMNPLQYRGRLTHKHATENIPIRYINIYIYIYMSNRYILCYSSPQYIFTIFGIMIMGDSQNILALTLKHRHLLLHNRVTYVLDYCTTRKDLLAVVRFTMHLIQTLPFGTTFYSED